MQGLSSLDNSPHSPASISPIQKSLQLSQKNTVGGESGRGSKSLPSSPILHGQALPTLPIVPSSLRARAVNQDEPADDAEISVSKETDDEEEIGEDVRIAPLLMMRAEGEVPTGYLPMPLGKPSPVERLSEAFPMIPALSISQISCCPSPSTLLLGTRCFIFNRTEFERQVLRKALEKHRSDVVFDSGNTNDTVNWINHNSLSDVDIVIANAREHGCAIVSYIVNAWAERWCHESDLTTRPHQSHSTANDFPSTPDSSSLSLPTLPCFVLLLPYSTLRKSLKMIYRHLKEEVDNSQKALQRKQSDEQYCSENEGDNQATNSNERVTPRHIHPENEAACPSAESRSGNEETIYAETRGRLQEFHCQATIIEALDNAQILYTIRKPIMLSSFAAQIARSYRSAQQPIKTKQSLLHRLVQTIRNSLNSSPFPISRLVCNSEGSSSVRTSRVQSETMSAPGTPHRTNKAFINRNEVVANVAISASVNITNEQEKNATSSIISPPLKYLPPLSDSGTVSNESKLNVLDARILIVEGKQ